MGVGAFESWLTQGLPKGFVTKKVIETFRDQIALGLYGDEEAIERFSSEENRSKVVQEGLYEHNLRRKTVEGWKENDILSALSLQLTSLGVSTRYEFRYLWFRNYRTGRQSYSSYTLMSLLSSVNLTELLVQFPNLDVQALLDRIQLAISNGSFHEGWTRGIDENHDFPVQRHADRISYSFPEYCASVIFSHYSGGIMPPDLSERYRAESLRRLISFEPGDAWKADFENIKDPESEHDFNQHYVFKGVVSQAAPLAKHAGIDPRAIAKRCLEMMNLYRNTDEPLTRLELGRQKLMLMNLLWDLPALWSEFELTLGDLFGVPYNVYTTSESRWSYERSLWRDALIQRNHTGSTLCDRMVKAMAARYPDIFKPELMARQGGTCTAKWFKGVKDFEPARAIINDMMSNDAWHYALENNRLSDLFSEDASFSALKVFLSKGGNANEERARQAIARYPEIVDRAVADISKVSEIKRLASVTALKADQMQALPSKMRDAIFQVNLGL